MRLIVRARPGEPFGTLSCAAWRYRCALGRAGIVTDKHEGDGGTPVGRFPLRRLYWRADRMVAPATGLPVEPIARDLGWSADPADPGHYNRAVRLPYGGSHERMWRDDALYDVVVVIGHNDSPPVPGRGSAIFMHLAHEDYAPTAGCVALARNDLLAVLAACGAEDEIEILAP